MDSNKYNYKFVFKYTEYYFPSYFLKAIITKKKN